MSNFVSLQTALTALRAAQVGIDTTSHNIANANTAGYTRQRVDLANRAPFQSLVGAIGTGVDVTDITRIRDAFLDARMRASSSELGRLQAHADLTGRTEALLGEPDFGISKQLGQLWAAFDDWSLRPADDATRQQVLNALDAVATRVREASASWERLHTDAELRLRVTVQQVNQDVEKLAAINNQILQSAGIGMPNDLLDERDRLIDALSAKIGITPTIEGDGTARITLNGISLLSGTRPQALTVTPTTLQLTHPSGATVPAGGEIRGMQDFLTSWLPGQRGALNDFARAFADTLNDRHGLGWRANEAPPPDSVPGEPLLAYTPGDEARTLTRAITSTTQLAAAGDANAERFDGRGALGLAALRNEAVGGESIDQRLRSFIASLAQDVSAAGREAESERGLNAAAASARRDHHAVSLDEELVGLLTYQRTYEAAARVATAVDEAMNTLINRLGVVGR